MKTKSMDDRELERISGAGEAPVKEPPAPKPMPVKPGGRSGGRSSDVSTVGGTDGDQALDDR